MMNQHKNRELDLKDALVRLGGNRELIEKMLGLFCNHVLNEKDHIESSINHCEWRDVKRWAHKTAGISGTLGLSNINVLCYELEKAADDQQMPIALSAYKKIIVKAGYLKGVKVPALFHPVI